MINRNIDMIEQMDNLFDYKEYLSKCKKFDVEPASEQLFYAGVGTLQGARTKYPNMDLQEAYIACFDDMAKQQKIEDQDIVSIKAKGDKKSSCCPGSDKDKKPPSILQKGINLAKASKEHLEAGSNLCDKAEYARRITICSQCTKLIPSKISYECIDCGCLMGIKASWAEQKCKLKKW